MNVVAYTYNPNCRKVEAGGFEASLSYRMRPCLKQTKSQKKEMCLGTSWVKTWMNSEVLVGHSWGVVLFPSPGWNPISYSKTSLMSKAQWWIEVLCALSFLNDDLQIRGKWSLCLGLVKRDGCIEWHELRYHLIVETEWGGPAWPVCPVSWATSVAFIPLCLQQDTAEISRRQMKYGGPSVIPALTQGQPGLHGACLKRKKEWISSLYGWLGMEDF